MKQLKESAWSWVPSLYFGEGLPYVAIMSMSVVFYKNLGLSNAEIAFYTSWFYLPWTLKFLWGPVVDVLKSKRWWIVVMQLLIGACFGGIALTLPGTNWLQWSMALFWLMAFSSATHDIAADGFYMHGLEERQQRFFIGIRNTFYRLAMICGQGLLIMLVGLLEQLSDNILGLPSIRFAWLCCFALLAILFVSLGGYHRWVLPRPTSDHREGKTNLKEVMRLAGSTLTDFFRKPHIVTALAFMLLYRFSEAQLVKIASPFLLDHPDVGGLGLSTSVVGFAYGTIGVIALVIGGIAGGVVLSKKGLSSCMMAMALALCLPNVVYVWFALAQPDQLPAIYVGIALEQLGYGYGFTAYTAYLLHFCRGRFQTAHYAFCTAIMALGMMLPGMFAGRLQEAMGQWFSDSLGGYSAFFLWIMLSTIPCFVVTWLAKKSLNKLTDTL